MRPLATPLTRQQTVGKRLVISRSPTYMTIMPKRTTPDHARLDRVVAESRRLSNEREATYRERALKLFPWICGRCGREFAGARLRELTVHHKDHNHDNNPLDGTNWELLCLYCHDNEHSRDLEEPVSYTHLRAHETRHDLVCRLLLEKKKKNNK